MKNQYLNEHLKDPISIREAASKIYVESLFNGPSIIKNIAHVEFIGENLDNVQFIKISSMPAFGEHLRDEHYFDQAISNSVDEQTLLGLDPNEKLKLVEQDSTILNSSLTSPKTIIEIPIKAYVEYLTENNRNRRVSSTVYDDQDNEFDIIKLTNLYKISVFRNPTSDNELAN